MPPEATQGWFTRPRRSSCRRSHTKKSPSPPPPVQTLRAPGYQLDPVVHHCVHDHVENGREQQVPLGLPPKIFERLSSILSRAIRHLHPVPVIT